MPAEAPVRFHTILFPAIIMKTATVLTSLLAVALSVPALAQTELNTRPPLTPSSPIDRSALPPTPLADPNLYPTSSLGIDLGWGGPYGGLGFSYAYLIGQKFDINAGVGLGVGGKIGVGARYFLTPTRRLSPYFGFNLSRTGRLENVDIVLDEGTPNEEKAIFSQAPSGVAHMRAGVRWQPGRVGLIGTLGYGARFTGDPVTYASPNGQFPSQRMRNLIDIVSPGGLEISLGMSIGLGR